MKGFLGIRYSLILMLLPLIVIIIILTSLFSVLEARSAMTLLANRHLAYKSEELRDFAYSEWETIRTLGLEENEELKGIVEESILSFSRSLLRERSESIYFFDSEKNLILELTLESSGSEVSSNLDMTAAGFNPGWTSFSSDGEERVGILFEYTPLDWYILFSDMSETFFSEIRNIQKNSLIILLIAIAAVLILTPQSVKPIIRHVEDLSAAALDITENLDLSRRVERIPNDETGLLAERFNSMLEALQQSNVELEEKRREEQEAREAAEAQEREALFLLSRISDIRDENTGNHLKRIGLYSQHVGKLLNLPAEEQDVLLHAAPLHDIGKIGVPDAILLKPARLSDEEYAQMKLHTSIGFELLKSSRSRFLREGGVIAQSHHERWDGSGYPAGLKGEDIPLYGRIVSIVDVFDALLSERPYKKPFTRDKAYELIEAQKGIHFDPALTELFLANFKIFCEMHRDN